MTALTDLESTFAYYMRILAPEIEMLHNYPSASDPHWKQIAHGKAYKWDYVHIPSKTCVELQGGIYGKGRQRGSHIRPKGYERDCQKMAMAAVNGWQTVYLTSGMLDKDPDKCIGWVKEIIANRSK